LSKEKSKCSTEECPHKKAEEIKKKLNGAKLICDSCGGSTPLDIRYIETYLSWGFPEHCNRSMRIYTADEQKADADEAEKWRRVK